MDTDITMKSVRFPNRDHDMAGNLFLPKAYTEDGSYAAIVVSHPGTSCKEQTSGIYARRLAEHGFVTMAYDSSYRSESGGTPRGLEDAPSRVEDISAVIDYLVTVPGVDAERIAALGICAGGGFTLNCALTDKRIKAVGTVSGADMGRTFRAYGAAKAIEMMEMLGRLRSQEMITGKPQFETIKAHPAEGLTDPDLIDSNEYYFTERGHSDNSLKERRNSMSTKTFVFDPLHFCEDFLNQPLQIIVPEVRGAFGSHDFGYEVMERAASTDKNILEIKGARHFDLYDKPECLKQTVPCLADFFHRIVG